MSSKINLQTCEYARKSSIFQDNQLILYKPIIQNDKTGLLHTPQQKRPELFSQKALQLWSFALTLTVLMKRIKQEQHIEIQEKSQ